MTYGLLEYYNDVQTLRGIGEVFDLKYVHLMIKGLMGVEKMSELDEVDYNDPVLVLAKRKSYLFFYWKYQINKCRLFCCRCFSFRFIRNSCRWRFKSYGFFWKFG